MTHHVIQESTSTIYDYEKKKNIYVQKNKTNYVSQRQVAERDMVKDL